MWSTLSAMWWWRGVNAGSDSVLSSDNWVLGANVENLTLTGGLAINGGGNGLANVLTGNTAANVLNGFAGVGSMACGAGDDAYVVDNAGDVVTELAGGGIDLMWPSVNHTLAAEVENLTLFWVATSGTGNGLATILTGNNLNNRLNGAGGDDLLIGGGGNDTLTGGSGADTFLFNGTISNEAITDFGAGAGPGDVISLALGSSFTVAQSGADTVLHFGVNSTVTLLGVTMASLSADDFAFFRPEGLTRALCPWPDGSADAITGTLRGAGGPVVARAKCSVRALI